VTGERSWRFVEMVLFTSNRNGISIQQFGLANDMPIATAFLPK
jgi:hypothetical protein